ncbi:type VI secretion system transmembrane protein TssO [Myroides sp. DW712]|uniref:type VI secretion system transmembrane protein TssO n=1 Tax=Myroides sp. DW712 TaxID=3389800 RepID=UPI00397D23E7
MAQFHSSLSQKEQRYQLLYLIGMLIFVLVLLGAIFLRGYSSPFAKEAVMEAEMLDQKYAFNVEQKRLEPIVASTFHQISILTLTYPKPIEENEINHHINQLTRAFTSLVIDDPRKAVYGQMASFYGMYLEDKKIIAKKTENIELFRKQFEACSIGFKDKEQQLIQRRNSVLTR